MDAVSDLYPTPTRLKLADAIDRGEVKGYNHLAGPEFRHVTGLTDRKVTADVDELLRAELARWDTPPPGDYAPVRLTDAGQAWQAAAQEHRS